MDVYGVAGVPDLFMVHMVLVCGKILVGDGLLFHIIFYMILVMGRAVHGSGRIGFEVDPHPTRLNWVNKK